MAKQYTLSTHFKNLVSVQDVPSGVQEIQNTINVCHCTSVISLLKRSQCFSKYSHLLTKCLEWSWMCVCSDPLPSAGVR